MASRSLEQSSCDSQVDLKLAKKLESCQVVYVTRDSDKLFLNRETCAALGIITKDFPTIGEALHVGTDDGTNQKTQAENLRSQPGPTCDCPRNQARPRNQANYHTLQQ